MRLINTKTYELHEFVEWQRPSYVILSHRWSDGEITFAQYTDSNYMGTHGHSSNGWKKIKSFCDLVAERESKKSFGMLEWVWIDTCCIDKSSSAELSEAINSMFKWYSEARFCITYLFNVHGAFDVNQFRRSEWFTRGWTLQELLAPRHVEFLNSSWESIGTKSTLAKEISAVTCIPVLTLRLPDQYPLEWLSVAERMSWAAGRLTTRQEDIAYCLLGLFGVNMPLLYGEGGIKAFHRLQLEILGQADDESIFVWDDIQSPYPDALSFVTTRWSNSTRQLLADHPTSFEKSGSIKRTQVRYAVQKPWTKNNIGLSICRLLYPMVKNIDSIDPTSFRTHGRFERHKTYFATKIMPIECVQWDGHQIHNLALGLAPIDSKNDIFAATSLYEYSGILKEGIASDFIVRLSPGYFDDTQLQHRAKNTFLILLELQLEIKQHILNFSTVEISHDSDMKFELELEEVNALEPRSSIHGTLPLSLIVRCKRWWLPADLVPENDAGEEGFSLQSFLNQLMLPQEKIEELVSKGSVVCRLFTDEYNSLLKEKRLQDG